MYVEPVTLEGKWVRLEPLGEQHVEDLAIAGDEDEIWTWMPIKLKNAGDIRAWMAAAHADQAAGPALPFAIIELASGKAVGSTRFMDIRVKDRGIEIGWTWLAKQVRRTPVNTECKYLLMRQAFEGFGCIRLQLKTDSLNERSRNAILRIGAQYEGILRNHMIRTDGTYRHSAYYSVIDSEWPELKARLERILAAEPSVVVTVGKAHIRMRASIYALAAFCLVLDPLHPVAIAATVAGGRLDVAADPLWRWRALPPAGRGQGGDQVPITLSHEEPGLGKYPLRDAEVDHRRHPCVRQHSHLSHAERLSLSWPLDERLRREKAPGQESAERLISEKGVGALPIPRSKASVHLADGVGNGPRGRLVSQFTRAGGGSRRRRRSRRGEKLQERLDRTRRHGARCRVGTTKLAAGVAS